MAIGSSGRVVIDIDPDLKRRLHSALARDALSLKHWFVERCLDYLEERSQPNLFSRQSTRSRGQTDASGGGE